MGEQIGEALYIVGYIGGYLLACSAPFQLYKCWTTYSTKDISWLWLTYYLTGICMLFSYAKYEGLQPIWVPLTLEISSMSSLLALKIKLDVLGHARYDSSNSMEEVPRNPVESELELNQIEANEDCL